MREKKDSGIEWIGAIPINWSICRIGNIFSLRDERNYKRMDEVTLLSLYAGIGVFPRGEYEERGNKAVTVEGYKIVRKNDIVVNIILSWMGALGISYYNGVTSPAYDVYIPNIKKVIPRFFHYVFRTTQIANECYRYGKGIMLMRLRTYSSEFRRIKVPLPSLNEQQKIADFIDHKCSEIDALTSDIQTQIETLEEYKKSVITEAVTKGLDPNVEMKDSGVEWIGKIPKDWDVVKGKFVFSQRNDRGNVKSLCLLSPTQKYGVIPQDKYEELTGMKAVKLNEKTNLALLKTIHVGDFCISLRSFQGGFEYSEYEGVVSPAYQIFFPYIPSERRFFKYLFKDQTFIDKMNSFTLSLRDGKNIAFADFANSYIPMPPIEKQRQIADFLDHKCSEIDQTISEKQQQLETLAEYKKSLIYEYVTGKKEVA